MYFDQIEKIKSKYDYIEERLQDPQILADPKKYAQYHREYKALSDIIRTFNHYRNILDQIKQAEELLHDEDASMRQLAEEELNQLREQRQELEQQLQLMLLPKDREDQLDVLFEIRAGTGGDEASLFVGDLFRMYTKFFDTRGFDYEVIYAQEGTVGGFNKVVMEVHGTDVYGTLKFESGVHRVQRVPKTETHGRLHTSAATVAVLPINEESDIQISKDELKIDTFRSSGPGGQHANKTESAVRITHLPTGIVVESQDSRSQLKNREIALQRLYQKLKDLQYQRDAEEQSRLRRSLVKSGDRSDKIRTYNFPQNRLTDHRIQMSWYNLDKIITGQLDEVIQALQQAERAQKLQSLEQIQER